MTTLARGFFFFLGKGDVRSSFLFQSMIYEKKMDNGDDEHVGDRYNHARGA